VSLGLFRRQQRGSSLASFQGTCSFTTINHEAMFCQNPSSAEAFIQTSKGFNSLNVQRSKFNKYSRVFASFAIEASLFTTRLFQLWIVRKVFKAGLCVGLPNAFCKNTGHFVNSVRFKLCRNS